MMKSITAEEAEKLLEEAEKEAEAATTKLENALQWARECELCEDWQNDTTNLKNQLRGFSNIYKDLQDLQAQTTEVHEKVKAHRYHLSIAIIQSTHTAENLAQLKGEQSVISADLRDNSWHSPGILADKRSLIDKHAAQQEQVQWQGLMAVAKKLLGEGMEYDSRNFRADDQPGADAAEFSNEDEASIGEKTNNQ